jgi:hypothetical protein
VNERRRAHGPAPSIWPVTLATGVGLAALGVLTSPVVIAAGALVVAVSLVGWIRQALDEVAR